VLVVIEKGGKILPPFLCMPILPAIYYLTAELAERLVTD
jgi:hypothetical protein